MTVRTMAKKHDTPNRQIVVYTRPEQSSEAQDAAIIEALSSTVEFSAPQPRKSPKVTVYMSRELKERYGHRLVRWQSANPRHGGRFGFTRVGLYLFDALDQLLADEGERDHTEESFKQLLAELVLMRRLALAEAEEE